MKKGIIVTLMALLAALAVTTVAAAAPTYMSIATGGTSGTYYVVGGAIASAITKGGKIQCTAETGNASVANLNLVATRRHRDRVRPERHRVLGLQTAS